MTLPSPPSSISLSQVNIELGNPGTTEISMNDAAVRTLFAKPTGAIAMSDGYGKSASAAIASISVTIPHPQPFPPAVWPAGAPGLADTRKGTYLQFNAGPIPAYPGTAPPGAPAPTAFPAPNPKFVPAPGNPHNSTLAASYSWGGSCSPASLARQLVVAWSGAGGAIVSPLADRPPTSPQPVNNFSPFPISEQFDGICRKDVTVTYTGGPGGPGPHTDATALTWSVATSCPDYAPPAGLPITVATPGVPAVSLTRTAGVVSTSVPKVVIDMGINKVTRGAATWPGPPVGPGAGEPFPAYNPANGPSWHYNVHSRWTITGTAPGPGGASGSTTWGVVCLPLDTEVTMEDGSVKPMKDVKVGDKVKTFDPDTNEISSNEVTHLLKRHVASELIHIKLENDIEFRATPEHECWIRREDEGMWIMAELIEEGDSMLTEGIEYQKVVKVEKVEYEEGIEVGNISVAGAHVYFANKVLMHNFTGL